MKVLNRVVVCYHSKCADGVGGLYAIMRLLESKGYEVEYSDTTELERKDRVTTIPCYYGMDIENIKEHLDEDTDLYIVDFSFDRDTTLELIGMVNYFVLLDHHQTAIENLDNLHYRKDRCHFTLDNEHSGAYLAMQYVENSSDYRFTPSEKFVLTWIEDRDLYNFKYPDTPYFSLSFELRGRTLKSLKEIIDSIGKNPSDSEVIKEGKILKEYKDRINSEILSISLSKYRVEVVKDNVTYLVPFLNANNAFFASEIGALLYNDESNESKCGFTYNISTDFHYVSLSYRSRKDSELKALDVLNYMGAEGGGHADACGGRMTTFAFFEFLERNSVYEG